MAQYVLLDEAQVEGLRGALRGAARLDLHLAGAA